MPPELGAPLTATDAKPQNGFVQYEPIVAPVMHEHGYNGSMKKTLLSIALLFLSFSPWSWAKDGASLALAFEREVDIRLDVPEQVQARYAAFLDAALADIPFSASQYLVMMDRNPHVQAIFIYWLEWYAITGRPSGRLHFIGASPASSGKPGHYDHFITPVGVYTHTLDNKDYRAEGTFNDKGIRGFGIKGMRVFDFGWALGERGWGRGGMSQMRLMVHATDPDHLEHRLGVAMSKGCIRIPATLNSFIDRYGLLDADYEQAQAYGAKLWVLRPDRVTTLWPGSYLVIIDSGSATRPAWSPQPATRRGKANTKRDTVF